MKKILMILTSHEDMENTDSKTGLWLGEFTDPYYEFIDEGYEVTLASPKGGRPPVDPMSTITENITASNRRFQDDEAAQLMFSTTIPLTAIDSTKYDAVFFPGGHGPIWDLVTDTTSGQLILNFLTANKPVAAVCHGPAALLAAEALQPGLLNGKRLTAFSHTEEVMAMRADNVPYDLEGRLKELGADFKSALLPYTSNVEEDGLLITGQNPLSAGPAAQALIKRLNATL